MKDDCPSRSPRLQHDPSCLKRCCQLDHHGVLHIIMGNVPHDYVHTPSASTVSLQGSHCQIPSYSHPFWTIIVAGLGPCFFIAGLGPTESVAHNHFCLHSPTPIEAQTNKQVAKCEFLCTPTQLPSMN